MYDQYKSPTLQFFDYSHLPPKLQDVSKPFYTLAHTLQETLPDSAEKSAMFRKLLEAKDCAVRAFIGKF